MGREAEGLQAESKRIFKGWENGGWKAEREGGGGDWRHGGPVETKETVPGGAVGAWGQALGRNGPRRRLLPASHREVLPTNFKKPSLRAAAPEGRLPWPLARTPAYIIRSPPKAASIHKPLPAIVPCVKEERKSTGKQEGRERRKRQLQESDDAERRGDVLPCPPTLQINPWQTQRACEAVRWASALSVH